MKKMKKLEVILKEENDRFIIEDKDGNRFSDCARKGDAKKVLKTKKGEHLVLVDQFTETKPKICKVVEQDPTEDFDLAKDINLKKENKSNNSKYEDYKIWITKNVDGENLHSKSNKLKAFAKQFNVTYMEKYNRCRPFEEALKAMENEGVIEKWGDNLKRSIYRFIEGEL